jgi:O-antigen/teichoic acid export membrane protein
MRFAVAILCTFILTPKMVEGLGPQDYGLWTLVLCIAGYLELFDCGLSTGAMRFIASASSNDADRKNRLVSTLIIASLGLGVLVALTCIVLAAQVDASSTSTHPAVLPVLIGLMGLRVMTNLPLGILMGVLFGEHRIWLINGLRILSVSAYTTLCYVALAHGYGMVTVGVIYAVIYSLEYFGYGLAARSTATWLRVLPTTFDKSILREVAGFSLSSFTANAANVVLMRTDPFIVAAHLSLGAVALYSVPLRITEQLFVLAKQLINVFSPLFAELHGRSQQETIRSAYLTCSKFALGLMVGIIVPALTFGQDGLRFWVGEEFAGAAPILWILLSAAILRVLQESSANALAMTGDHVFVARLSIVSAVGNVGMSLALVRVFGINGVALATLLSVAVFGCAVGTIRVCRSFDISAFAFARHVLVPLLVPTAAQLTLLRLISLWSAPTGLSQLFVASCLSGIVYLFTYLAYSLNATERAVVGHWVSQLRTRISERWPTRRSEELSHSGSSPRTRSVSLRGEAVNVVEELV